MSDPLDDMDKLAEAEAIAGNPPEVDDDDPPFDDGIEELDEDEDFPFDEDNEDEDGEGEDCPDDFQLG